jgi:predicted Kef-type K+ transport protein
MTSVWHYEDSLVTIRGSWIEWIHADPFYEVAAILAAAACLGAAGLALRQPPIVVFLAVGVLVGPSVSGLIRSYDEVELFAHIGIALLLFFFIDLGARLEWSTVGSQAIPAAVFSLFVLIGNPLIVMAIMGYMGYRRRTGFLAGLAVAQISEFSLILAALGVSLGHIGSESMGLVTLVGVVTIFASTYMILYSAPLYRLLSEPLKVFERRLPHREAGTDLVGAGRAHVCARSGGRRVGEKEIGGKN